MAMEACGKIHRSRIDPSPSLASGIRTRKRRLSGEMRTIKTWTSRSREDSPSSSSLPKRNHSSRLRSLPKRRGGPRLTGFSNRRSQKSYSQRSRTSRRLRRRIRTRASRLAPPRTRSAKMTFLSLLRESSRSTVGTRSLAVQRRPRRTAEVQTRAYLFHRVSPRTSHWLLRAITRRAPPEEPFLD